MTSFLQRAFLPEPNGRVADFLLPPIICSLPVVGRRIWAALQQPGCVTLPLASIADELQDPEWKLSRPSTQS